MKILLRSVFKAEVTDEEELLFQNFLVFLESGLGFEIPEDGTVWAFIKSFGQTHNHVPSLQTLRTHFEKEKKIEILDRLEILITFSPIYKGDFIRRVESRAEERRTRYVLDLFREATQIIQTGIEIKDKREKKSLKGPIDAIRHVMNRSHDIISPTLGSRLSGEALSDGLDFKREYERIKTDPDSGLGQFTGIRQLDEVLWGAKRHELWIHAAWTGGLKSTFMLNWAYNQAIWMGHSPLIFSLEMSYSQCRRILYALHSMHRKFRSIRHQLGIQKDDTPNSDVGIEYSKIKTATLNDAEEQFLMDCVIPDFDDSKNYGKIHIEVADPDKTDFTISDLRSKAELIHSKSPISMVFVDHAGLLAPRRWVSSTSERQNEVIRDLKKMSMSFNRGQGIAMVTLFQINREGFKAASKNEGRYNLTHLSYANECERSGDIITAAWIDDEMRKNGRLMFQCLKTRDEARFEPFFSNIEWSCRRLLVNDEVDILDARKEDLGNKIEDQLGDVL